MSSRRRFLETLSALPFVRGFTGATAASVGVAAASAGPGARAGRDYFRELGLRPFINAAGTFTSMSASLMPPEVLDAIQYASRSALTLGTAATLTGTDQKKVSAVPDLRGLKSEVVIQKSHRFEYDHAVRNCGVRLVEPAAVPGVTAEVFVPEIANHVPHVRVRWDAAAQGITTDEVVAALKNGEPSIRTRPQEGVFVAGVWMLKPGEEKIVARRLREILQAPAKNTA